MPNWELEWQAAEFPVRVDSTSVTTPAGERQKHYQVTVGEASFAGSVAVPIARDTGRILLVRQERMRIGQTLWELPRGMADLVDADPVATALRELHEETGLPASSGEFLGMIYPDSGFLTSEVAVVRVSVISEDVAVDPADGEVERHEWFSVEELRGLIASGELRDALSLGALAVAGVLR